MNWDIKQFLIDEKNLTSGKFREKYKHNVPIGLSIDLCAKKLLDLDMIDIVVDDMWDSVKEDFYLVHCDNRYEI